jgi:hypothetical protein
MTYLLSFPIPSFEFLLKMTFRVMTKVMNNFKRLGNSTLNELVNENVIPLFSEKKFKGHLFRWPFFLIKWYN